MAGLQEWEPNSLKVIGWPNAAEIGNQLQEVTFDQRWAKITAPAGTVENLMPQNAAGEEKSAVTDPGLETSPPIAKATSEPLELHAGLPN